jgi:hypothetical protein
MKKPSIRKVAACVSAALGLVYAASSSATITEPGGFGESFMHFTNFQFRQGNNAAGISPGPVLGTAGITGTETSTASAILNGIGVAPTGCGVTNLGVSYTCQATTGVGFAPLGPLTPQTDLVLAPVGAGSAGYSSSLGDSRTGTAEVYLHSLSQLNGPGNANSSGTQDLNSQFVITTGIAGIPVELTFNMERFIRAGLGQDQISANATSVFNLTVKRDGQIIFLWAPSGDPTDAICRAGFSCNVFSDPFSLNSNITVDRQIADRTAAADGSQIDYTVAGTQTGFFEAELFLPGGFTYIIEINGRVTSSTRLLPEPGTIALLGLGLFGLGVVLRKKQQA